MNKRIIATLTVFGISFAVLTATHFYMFNLYRNQIVIAHQNTLQSMAESILSNFDVAMHMTISQRGDEQKQSYKDLSRYLKNALDAANKQNPAIKNVYTMFPSKEDSSVQMFGVDADESLRGKSFVGEVYRELPKSKLGWFDFYNEPFLVNDQWGQWLSGEAKMVDKDGKIIGELGVDMNSQALKSEVLKLFVSLTVSLILGGLAIASACVFGLKTAVDIRKLKGMKVFKKKVTVMFADLRGFTSYAETLKPEDVISELNEHLSTLTDIIENHRGRVLNYMGDGIMAVFGSQSEDADQEVKAVEAALKMQRALKNHAASSSKFSPDLAIGITQGYAVLGPLGSGSQPLFSAVGDTVNLASRLEKASKDLNVPIVISGYVSTALKGHFATSSLGSINVKGRKEAVSIFGVNHLESEQKAG